MYSAERRQEILLLLEQKSRVTVDHLATYFGVSRSSIRRDLSQLHENGLLTRTYGGAVVLNGVNGEAPFSERQVVNFAEKDRIGKAAAQLIAEDETIFIDGGTTTECMLPYLVDKRVTVVTYGLNIINRLSLHPQITLIAIGGTLHRHSLTFSGVLALNSLEAYNIHYDKTFMAASGVSATAGITNASLEEIPIKRRAFAAGQQNILLADASKVGVIRAGWIAPLNAAARLVTGSGAPPEELEAIQALGVWVTCV
ncbi:MAG: DeoR/GlpR transcriptional regulator [Caldilineaceae bacterium]|nr:DeoR/GlpR transcriptional regulator [Caldilineaceae bacterium]